MAPSRTSSLVSRSSSAKSRSSRPPPRDPALNPSLLTFLVIIVVGVPACSYLLLHKSVVSDLSTMSSSILRDTQEVEKLRSQVAEMDALRTSLAVAVESLRQLELVASKPAPVAVVPAPAGSHFDLGAFKGSASAAVVDARCKRGGGGGVAAPDLLSPRSARQLFKDKYDGTFVDVGAGDGIFLSKTVFFEHVLCWNGVVVEPSPVEFPKLKANRPFSIAFNAAVDEQTASRDFTDVTKDGKWSGWSGFQESWTEPHKVQVDRAVAQEGFQRTTIPLRTSTLTDILASTQFKEIDLLTVAVEGHEISVIRSLDLTRFPVKVIQVEVEASQMDRVNEMEQHLTNRGYSRSFRLWPGHKDMIFLHNSYVR
mmetsp:Transcript_38154/g.73177  ORF Transcript_38154/g.73177 Transcript_38154/m.73177 type:complete len:368 (+) Transcript_38154:57-1160(+)